MEADSAPEKLHDPVSTGSGMAGTESVVLPIGTWLKPQWVSALVLAVALSPLDLTAAYSSLFGSMAAFLPAVFFAVFAGRKRKILGFPASQPERNLYAGSRNGKGSVSQASRTGR